MFLTGQGAMTMKKMGAVLRTECISCLLPVFGAKMGCIFTRSGLGWMPGVVRTSPRFVMTQRFSLSGICFLFSHLGTFSLHMDEAVCISSKRLYISLTYKVGCEYNFYL